MTSIDRHPGPERYDLMREKTVEQKLVKAVKNRGGICPISTPSVSRFILPLQIIQEVLHPNVPWKT